MLTTEQGTIKPIVYVGIVNAGRLLIIEYKEPPNPQRSGWWIPAPELAYGEDPSEKAQEVVRDLGFDGADPRLLGVESFVSPGGWHLLTHYVCKVSTEPKPSPAVIRTRWIGANELKTFKEMAHGAWETRLGVSMIAAA